MRRLLLLAVVLTACALGVGGAHAQSYRYPSRPITIIAPFPEGGSTDTVARIMAERLQPIGSSRAEDELRTLRGERARRGSSDAGAGAGHERSPALHSSGRGHGATL